MAASEEHTTLSKKQPRILENYAKQKISKDTLIL